MKSILKDNKGFTLVELMITVLIVGILASVAIPLYQANVKRAKASEADAALGSIRTALRVYYAENGVYPTAANYIPVYNLSIDVDSTDIVGRYFPPTAYTYQSTDGINYTIRATGSGQSAGIYRQMDQAGILSDFTP